VVSFEPRALYSRGKSPLPRYPLDRRLGGPQSRSGRRGEEKMLDPTENFTVINMKYVIDVNNFEQMTVNK
jgi:hypothetical protein